MWLNKKFDYISTESAHKLLMQSIKFQPKRESISVSEANSRVLAENIVSDVNIPSFDVSHFDGYAVRAEDTYKASSQKPVCLRVVSQANKQEYRINPGETAPILTGNPLPAGADSVIPVERIKLEEEAVKIHHSSKPLEHVIPKGRDVKAGEKIFKTGHLFRPQDTKLLMDIKIWNVWVFKKPKVVVASIGNELTNCVEQADLKKFSSLEIMIAIMIAESGGIPIRIEIVQDEPETIRQAVRRALGEADIVTTIGGSSVGEKDYTWEAINSLNPSLKIRGIKIHPGRVTSFGLVENKPVVMLAGHVQSALVGFFTMLLPIIQLGSGITAIVQPTLEAKMGEKLAIEEFVSFKRVRFVKLNEVNGHFIAIPELGDSSLTSILVKTNGYVIINENKTIIRKGERVRVNFLPGLFPLQLLQRN